MQRIARDPVTGRNYYVPADMTYKQWRQAIAGNTLTNNEKYAINKYTGAASYSLNAKLRDGIKLTSDEMELMKNLDAALGKLPPYQGVASRSLFFDENGKTEFLSNISVGGNYASPAYMSATTDIYDESDDVRLIIQSTRGRDLRIYNRLEQEILFKRNEEFLITAIEEINEKTIVYLEEAR